MRRLAFAVLAVATAGVIAGTAGAQDDEGARPVGGESMLAVVGGDVHVGNGIVFRRGTVLCRGGKILDVGTDLDVPEGARVIDAKGRWVLPGFVATNGANFGIQRGRPRSGEKYADCLDPDSLYAELALSAGITCYYASGRMRGISGDQTAVIKPAFGAPELMMVKEPAALEVSWSRASVTDRGNYRALLERARSWIAAGKKGRPPAPSSVLSALERDIPVRVNAQSKGDIVQAIAFAKEFDLRLVLEQTHEAWAVAPEVAASGAICIVQPRARRWPEPGKEDSTGTTIECAAILEKAGVPFCVLPPGGFGANPSGISLGGVVGRDMLTYPLEGAFAIRGGASADAALRAITLTAAEALGVDHRVGSLERGKDADIVIYQGDPFDYRLMPEVTIVSGRVLYERTTSTLFGHLPAPLSGDGISDETRLDLLSTWVRVLSLRTRLLRWYDREKRDLPWRASRNPYHVLVSELMLQQTRVDVVLPYFERWTRRWPTIADLAAATEDEVLAEWSGLGYYRRARSLLAVATTIVDEHDGAVPSDPAVLRSLPGIGPYTAAAVAAIAYDVVVPVVDGNVERVLCRLLADDREPSAARKRTIAEAARRLVTGLVGDDPQAMEPPEGLRPADWNQAMMELGAMVCTPGEPRCPLCPWRRSCVAYRAGLAAELPRRKEKKALRDVTLRMAVVRRGERVLLVQRAEGSLLSGMWELPTTDEEGSVEDLVARVGDALGSPATLPTDPVREFRHGITTRRITVHVHETELPAAASVAEDRPGTAWARPQDLRDFGLSSMTRKALAW